MKLLNTIVCFFASVLIAAAQLTVSVTPGYRFNNGESITLSKLNQGFTPTVSVAGTVTGSSLAAGGVNAVNITTNALDQLTILGGYDGSATTKLRVNYDTNTLAIVAGKLGVGSNALNYAHFSSNTLRLNSLTNNWLDDASWTTNLLATFNTNNAIYTNTFIPIGVSYNVGTNGSPTNTTFKLTTLQALQTSAIYTAANTNLINTLASNLFTATRYMGTNSNALSAGVTTFTHPWTNTPSLVRAVLLCITNDGIFRTNEELTVESAFVVGGSFANYSVRANASNIIVASYGSPRVATNDTLIMNLTEARWRLKVIAQP